MLCFRCGSQVPDGVEKCPNCSQAFSRPQVDLSNLQERFKVLERRRRSALVVSPERDQQSGRVLAAGQVVARRYEVVERIGAASVGNVYKVRDRQNDGRELALKRFPADLFAAQGRSERLAEQLAAVRKLGHPSIVRVYADGLDEGHPYYAMQLLEGMSLHKVISLRRVRDSFFDLEEIEPILAQVSLALQHAHRVTCHGCLMPEDIIVLPNLVKVVDFGLAVAIPGPELIPALEAAGTAAYLAPEVRAGGAPDARSDIYSVGVIMAEMLAGARGLQPGEKLSDKNPALPPAVDALYERATAANPEERYRSVEELSEDLASLIDTGRVIGATDLGGEASSTPPLGEAPPMPEDLREEEAELPYGGSAAGIPPAPPRPDATDPHVLVEEILPEPERESPPPLPANVESDLDARVVNAWQTPAAADPTPVPASRPARRRGSSTGLVAALGVLALAVGVAAVLLWLYGAHRLRPTVEPAAGTSGLAGRGPAGAPVVAAGGPSPPTAAAAGSTALQWQP